MGLDMHACVTSEQPDSPVDFTVNEQTELHYWRKHPNLHGWMEQLYRDKGGKRECFNCTKVQLDEDDLERLERAICENGLPHTEGFFFGASDGSETADDLAFIRKARQAIAAGGTVYYDSWWWTPHMIKGGAAALSFSYYQPLQILP